MPNNYQTTKQVRNYEEERARVLELIYEVHLKHHVCLPCCTKYILHYTTQCCIMKFDCFEAETVQFCNSQNSNFENAAPWVICVCHVLRYWVEVVC